MGPMTIQSIMHEDILSRLFGHLSPDLLVEAREFPAIAAERKIRRHTLAMSARVCRAFSEAALNVLWRTLDDITQLFSVIPSYSSDIGMFTRMITEEQWLRFQEYANRVRILNKQPDDKREECPPDTTWVILMQRSSRSPLLPRLEELSTSFSYGMSAGALMLLLNPALKHLDLRIMISHPSDRCTTELLVDIVQPHLAHIKSLTLHEYNGTRAPIPGRIDFESLTHLQNLRISHSVNATTPMLQALSEFTRLRALSLDFALSTYERLALSDTNLESGFSALRELQLTAKLEDASAFLQATKLPHLESLTVTRQCNFANVAHTDFNDALYALYALIPHAIHGLHLRFVEFDEYYPENTSAIHFACGVLLPDAVRALPGLRALTVSFENLACSVSDADLLALRPAWPALSRFEFTAAFRNRTTVYSATHGLALPTFGALVAFAHARPGLTRLALPALAAGGLPPDVHRREGRALLSALPRHSLRLLGFCDVVPRTPIVTLALALDRAFPALDVGHVAVAGRAPVGGGRRPEMLMTLLLTLQTARRCGAPAGVQVASP
ncbi:hypothetical protein BD413DRAFT_641172 [Trametes elegans]|nr:hypothetical protein BD413DRAFT_641172 [Trametes elegans]